MNALDRPTPEKMSGNGLVDWFPSRPEASFEWIGQASPHDIACPFL